MPSARSNTALRATKLHAVISAKTIVCARSSTSGPRPNRCQPTFRYSSRRRAVGLVEATLFRLYVLQAKHPVDKSRHKVTIPECTYAPWLVDTDFRRVYDAVSAHTLVPVYKLYSLWSCAKQTAHLEGDMLEVGVWRGGSGALLALAAKADDGDKRTTYGTVAGISATIDLFLLDQLGYGNLTLYDGSMGEWAKDKSLPIETDANK
jgi:hypothetical protein